MGAGALKQLMTSDSTHVARLPFARCHVEMTGNNEMSSISKHTEAYRPHLDAGCVLGRKIYFVLLFKSVASI